MSRNPLWAVLKHVNRLRPFPLLAKRQGVFFLLDPQNWIDNRLVGGIPYEVEQLTRAAKLIADRRLDTLIDVGANIGVYTLLLGRLPQIERVLAFEPVRRNFNQLCGSIFANGLDAKVDAYRVALSDRTGEAPIHIDPTSTGISRLDLKDCRRDHAVFARRETIATAIFDQLVTLENRRIFLKIDVEGHADQVLGGMERLFASNEIFLQIELDVVAEQAAYARLLSYGMVLTTKIDADCYFQPRGALNVEKRPNLRSAVTSADPAGP
jgi:FkbM family methyltransferase